MSGKLAVNLQLLYGMNIHCMCLFVHCLYTHTNTHTHMHTKVGYPTFIASNNNADSKLNSVLV